MCPVSHVNLASHARCMLLCSPCRNVLYGVPTMEARQHSVVVHVRIMVAFHAPACPYIAQAYNIVVVLEEESRSGARAHDPAATAASGRHGSSAAGGSSARASAFEGGRRSSAGGASHQEHAHAHDGPSWTPGGRTPMTLRSESMPAAAGFAGSGLKESPGQSVRAASCTLGELQEQKQEQGVPGASTTDGAIQLAPATQQQPLQVLQLQPQLQPQPGMSVPVLMLAQPGSAGSCQMQQVGGNWAQLPAAPAPGPVPFRGSASGGGAEAMQVTPFEWPVMPVHIMAMEQQSQAATTAVAPQQQGTAPSSEPSMGSQQIVSSPALTARTISAPPPSTTQQLQSFVIRDVQSGSSTGTAPAPAAQLVCPLPHPQPQPQQQQLQTPIPRQPMQLQPAPQLQPVHMQVPQTIQLQPQTQVQQIQLQPQLMFAPQHTQQVLQLAPAQRQQQQQQQAPMILSTGSQAGQQMQMGTVQTYGSACSPAPPAGGYVLVSAGAPRGQMFMTQGQDGGVLQLQQYVPVQTSSTSGSTILYNSIGSGMQLFQGTGLMAPQQFQPVQLHPSSAPQAAPLATSHGNQMMQPIQLQPAPQLAPHAAPSAANHPNTGSVLRWLQGQPQMQGVGELQQPPGAFTFPGTTSSQGLPTVIPISSLPTAMVQAHAAAQQDSGGVPPTKKVCLG